MDEEYDVIVLGTGLKECLLSGVLAVEGMKVLVVDRNDYYGGECGSINLQQLFKKFKNEDVSAENLISKFSPGITYKTDLDMRRWLHNWQIDLIPKFIMYTGELVQILVKTDVTRYLEFQKVAGSYVFHEGKIHKVPSTAGEAIKSGLMGFFEKRRCAKFLEFCENYKPTVPATHQGVDCNKVNVEALYDKFGLDANTRSFLGHACALWPDDKYLKTKPAIETINRILLYRNSLFRLQKSPYVYPRYGLTQLPEAFARLGAVHGSTYILDKQVDEIVYNEEGVAVGVRSGEEVAKCKLVIGDPSYFPSKVKVVGKVIRVICVLNHSIPDTENADSLQIIIPQKETNRRSDIYVMCLSSDHCVCPAGKYVAIISTNVETDNPLNEIASAIRLLGPIEEKFVNISDRYEPLEDGSKDKCFISKSYDETSHFESTAADVHAMYQRITGHEMDLTPPPKKEEAEETAE